MCTKKYWIHTIHNLKSYSYIKIPFSSSILLFPVIRDTWPSYWAFNGAIPPCVCVHYHSIFRQLLLDKNDFLGAAGDEVAPRVHGTLVEFGHLCRTLTVQNTVRASQHDRHSSKEKTLFRDHSNLLGCQCSWVIMILLVCGGV